MTENENQEQPVDNGEAPAQPPTPRARLRERVFSFRSLVAVGAATLLLGGLGGAGVVAVADHDDHPEHGFRHDGGPRPGGGPGFVPPGGFDRGGGGEQRSGRPS